ncbi:transcriptional regulatory protein DegU [mine drainage metagenome]|uniref:Transcriptional regulatory protein DegU n=1 Tax=mine drainage metagenome TaxID=410659 RepID=A0A1J5S368_9ZZZZ
MKPIRVLIIDDHTLFRSGIKLLLQRQEGFIVVGEAGDGLEGVKRAKQYKPDVVLLDLHMPGTSGLAAIPLLREEVPQAQVLMLTVSEDAEDLIDALHAGARGYLLKNIETDFLLQSIRSAARGESVMSPQMSGRLADAMRAPPQNPPPTPSNCTGCHLNPIQSQPPTTPPAQDLNKLSSREREIIIMLARGVSNKEIARDLDLAESTIKIHVQGILRKLNLTSRVQAAVYAVKNGLVSEA